MSEFQQLISKIKTAKETDPLWIPLRYPGLSDHVGITKRLYHMLGGDPGTGKTSFVDQTYVLDAHDYAYKNEEKVRLKTVYFSMERSQEYKKAKWLAHRMYTENNMLVSAPTLLNWGTGGELTDDMIETAESHSDFFNRLFEDVDIYDGIRNPTGIYKIMVEEALKNGTVYGRDADGTYYKTDLDAWTTNNGQSKKSIRKDQCPLDLHTRQREYIPDDERLIIQIIIDHYGKPRPERGYSRKETIDKTSEYMQIGRDFYGMSVVGISQFNRNNANIQRRVHTDLSPEQQDFKGTGNTYEDADIVMGLFNPYKHGLDDFKKYKIKKTLSNGFSRFRSISLLKNSYGADNLVAGFKFMGECGYFEQVAKPDNINYNIFNE